jgi:rubrerythrin
VKGKNQAALLRALAVEEQRHADVLENIIEFVSGPRQYLENAEWSGIGQQ